MKIVILGLGTAGFAAMLAIRKTNPSADIVIIDNKSFDLFHICGIPYVLSGKIESMDKLKYNIDFNSMKITKIKAAAVKVDAKAKTVKLDSNETINYDRLIIATGGRAKLPDVKGKEHAYTLDNYENAKRFSEAAKKIKQIAIIGGGIIGIETAAALADRGIKVNVVEMKGRILENMLDSDMSELLRKKLEQKGIKFYLSRRVEKIGKRYVVVEGRKSVKGDMVLAAAGIKPNLDFINRLLADKGVVVDDRMQTNLNDVYAAGDVIQFKHLVSGRPSLAWYAGTAYKQGTVAGTNAAGGSAKYKKQLGTAAIKISGIEAASTGLREDTKYFDAVSGKIKGAGTAAWHPDAEELAVKLLADKKSRRIIGGQAVGQRAADRINVIAAAIKSGMTADDFSDLEMGYCPLTGEAYDILNAAGDLVLRKL